MTVDDGTENPNWVAFRYGPVLLATELNRTNVDATYVAGVLVRMSTADTSVSNDIVVGDSAAFKADIAQRLVRIDDGENLNGMTTMRFRLQGTDAASAALTFEPYYSLYDARYAVYMNLIEPDSPQAQALILKDKQQQRISETTIDALTSFDNNNSEADKNYRSNKSAVGVWLGQGYRDGQMATDAYFQYDMIVDPSLAKNYLGVRYFGGDSGRTFSVYVNDVLLKNERITSAQGANSWYVQYDEIPASVIAGIPGKDSYKRDQAGRYVLDENGQRIPVVTVRFQGNGTSYVGGVYGVYTASKTTYDTDADLSALTVESGSLDPALAGGVYDYTVTVPEDATTATFDARAAPEHARRRHSDRPCRAECRRALLERAGGAARHPPGDPRRRLTRGRSPTARNEKKGRSGPALPAPISPFPGIRRSSVVAVIGDQAVLAEECTDLRVVHLVVKQLPGDRAAGEMHLLAVAQPAGRREQLPHVVRGVEDLGHAAFDVQQGVDGLHRRAHRVLRREDAVALLGLGELPDEGEVHRSFRDDIRAVSGLPRHEERGHVGHHHRNGLRSIGRELGDLLDGDAEMIEPLLRDLLTGGLLNGLSRVVPGHVGEQGVNPHHDLVGLLLLEVGLPVDGP